MVCMYFFFVFFFFSSRRRHTRSLRDWSSDVCSSDLHQPDLGRAAAKLAGASGEWHIEKGAICWFVDGRIRDRKSTRLNSSHVEISYAVFCLKKKKKNIKTQTIVCIRVDGSNYATHIA